jgi:hypothetical protein
MRTKTCHDITLLLACFTLFLSTPIFVSPAHAQTYHLDSQPGLPFPMDPYDGAEPVTTVDALNHIYRIHDNTNDWELLTAARQLDATSATMTMSADDGPPLPPGGTNSGGSGFTNNFQPLVFGSNLWIEITNFDIVNQQAFLRLHNSQAGEHYQLLSTNQLTADGQNWTLGDIITGSSDTNFTDFNPFFTGNNPQLFFRAHHGITALEAFNSGDAVAPNPTTRDPGTMGSFTIRSDEPLTNDLTVYYAMSGTGQNGVDYDTVSGVVTLSSADFPATNVVINPTANNRMQGDKTVTLTLLQNTNYLIDQSESSASLTIFDSFTVIRVFPPNDIMYRPDGPPGIPAQDEAFLFRRDDHQGELPPITVFYVMSGTASNGVDYALLSGSLDFSDGNNTVSLDVNPLAESVLKGVQTVVITLVPTNGYFVDPNNASVTNQIIDTSSTVRIISHSDATETNAVTGVGEPGMFQVSRGDDRGDYPPMTVNYQMSGTASNGVDYQTLSGSFTFADGQQFTNIFINTIEEDLIEPDETVTLTLVPNGNAYNIDTNQDPATLTIHTTIGFLTVATNLDGPIGIDYYAPSNSLMISDNEASLGVPLNFARIFTNIVVSGGVPVTNVMVTNWSGIGNIADEVYLVSPRMPVGALTNTAGFTNGDIFFGSDTGIGWLSAGAIRSNLDWCILTNAVVTNAFLLRGGICTDQTGTFSNQIIAVTTDGDALTEKGIWRVDSKGHPTLLAQILTKHLEGVATLTNDVQRWGPWAGKIITGDEDEQNIYTIDTNGVVATFATTNMIEGGIEPEAFTIIPTNSSLYLAEFNSSTVMELPASYFRNHVGDLLISDAGEVSPSAIFIVHWNSQGSNFVVTPISLPGTITHIEGTTFAPVQFPGN